MSLRITDASSWTGALGCVIDHLTNGALTTDSAIGFGSAGISALIVDTSLVGWAIVIVAATGHTDAVETYVSTVTEGVAVTHWAASTVDAS